MKVYWKKLHPDAQAPTKATVGSVGWDLRTPTGFHLYPLVPPSLIETGIAVACPPGCWLKIFERSGLASKGIWVHGGVIDYDYRGEIKIILYNSYGVHPTVFTRGDRIAQMVAIPLAEDPEAYAILQKGHVATPPYSKWEWVEADEETWAGLSTDRGEAGFGSSGR